MISAQGILFVETVLKWTAGKSTIHYFEGKGCW